MPNLKAAKIWQKYQEHFDEALVEFSYAEFGDGQIPITWPNEKENSDDANNTNNVKGERYELYIGSLYKARGYDVTHTGGSNDMGIDLLCAQDKNYVVCVQCKYRSDKGVRVADIFQFYGAMKYYSSQHLSCTVSGAFWTTQRISKGTKMSRVAESLGIKLFSGILLPQDFDV